MLSHKIRIYPNKDQKVLLGQSCGVSRFSWNWSLSKWEEIYSKGEKPTMFKVKKEFNHFKKTTPEVSWLYDVTKCSPEYAIKDLGTAYNRYFKKISDKPKFKKKGVCKTSFSISNDKFSVEDKWCKLPKISKIKMAEALRFDGKIMKGTISKKAGYWFLSITVDIEKPKVENKKAIGIDLGLKTQMMLSNGQSYNIPSLKKANRKIAKTQRQLSKKEKGSKNYTKQKQKVQRAYYELNNKKTDWIEKSTSEIAKNYEVVCLENLNIKGMMKNRKLSGKFQQVSLYRLVERLKTKTSKVIQIDRFAPSSKACSKCGNVKEKLSLSERQFICDCGLYGQRPKCSHKHCTVGHTGIKVCGQIYA